MHFLLQIIAVVIRQAIGPTYTTVQHGRALIRFTLRFSSSIRVFFDLTLALLIC